MAGVTSTRTESCAASGEMLARRIMRLSLLTLFVVMVSLLVVTVEADDPHTVMAPEQDPAAHGLADPGARQNDPQLPMRAVRGE